MSRRPGARPISASRAASAVFILATSMSWLYGMGAQREAARESLRGRVQFASLKYGSKLPVGALADSEGRSLRLRDLGGRWKLVLVGSVSCGACLQALKEAEEVGAAHHVSTLLVIAGRPLLGSAVGRARRYRAEHQLRSRVAVDPDYKVTTWCAGAARQVPILVLLDESDHVAYWTRGFQPGTLAGAVARITARSTVRVRPAPSQFGALHGGVSADPWRALSNGWVVATLVKPGCGPCNARVEQLAAFGDKRQMRIVLVYESPAALARGRQVQACPGAQSIWCPTTDLPVALRVAARYGVPRTAVFHDGALGYLEQGVAGETVLWELMGAVADGRLQYLRRGGSALPLAPRIDTTTKGRHTRDAS